MSEHFSYLDTRDAIVFGKLQVVCQRRVYNTFAYQRSDGDHAAVVGAQSLVVPYFAEQYVVVEFGKQRGKFAQLCATCGLRDFFLCHSGVVLCGCKQRYE